jgi:predicted O-methyltransferase YrrM
MSDEPWALADKWLVPLLTRDDCLGECLEANARAGLPSIDVSPLQGKLLHLLARIQGARRILEIGTLGGYSTIWLARALPAEGRLTTLELNPKHAEVARSNLARAGVAEKVDLIVGPALESLDRLRRENREPFDLIFIDADKTGYPEYLKRSIDLAHPGTVIIGDNVVRRGQIANPDSPDENVRAVRAFIEMAAAEPRLEAVVMQTVGAKGHDGFLLARVV